MRVSSVRAIMAGSRVEGSADAFWLARKEMRRAWPYCVLGASIVSFLGLVAAVSLSGVLQMDGSGAGERFYDAFFSDFLFLLVCAALGANTLLGYYTHYWRGTYSSRLAFLRSLPISAGALVGSRVLCMLSALMVGVLAFFLPVYFFSGLGEELGAGRFLSFCGLWVGYALLGAGLWLLLEFGVGGRAYALISYTFALTLMVVVTVLEWTAGLSLVARTAQLAQGGYGAPSSIFSVLAGGAAFVLLARASVRHVQKNKPLREPLRVSVDA
jgi:hypothetical protein